MGLLDTIKSWFASKPAQEETPAITPAEMPEEEMTMEVPQDEIAGEATEVAPEENKEESEI